MFKNPQNNNRRVSKLQKTSNLFTIANINFNTGLEAASYLLRCPPDKRLPQENFFISAHILKFDYFQNLLRKYGQAKFDYICHSMQSRLYEKGDFIFQQGDQAEEFYVVLTGSVSVVVKPKYNELDDLEAPLIAKEVKVLGPGEVFGELALIKGKHGTRAATIFCKETSDIAYFTNIIFNKLLLDKEKDRFDENLNILYSLEVFKDCPEQIIRNAFMYSRIKQFINNQLVYKQNDESEYFIIIKSGQFQKLQSTPIEEKIYQIKVCTMSTGEIFGYDELIDESDRKFQVKCVSSFGELFMIAKYDFKSRMFNNIVFRTTLLNLKKQNTLLLKQRIEQTENFDNLMETKLFASNYKKQRKLVMLSENLNLRKLVTHKNHSPVSSDEPLFNFPSKFNSLPSNSLLQSEYTKSQDIAINLPSLSINTPQKPPSFAEKVVKFKSYQGEINNLQSDSFFRKPQISYSNCSPLIKLIDDQDNCSPLIKLIDDQDNNHSLKQKQSVHVIKVNRQLEQPNEIKFYQRMMQKLERYQQVNEIQHQEKKAFPGKLQIYKSFFQFELDFSIKKNNQIRQRK